MKLRSSSNEQNLNAERLNYHLLAIQEMISAFFCYDQLPCQSTFKLVNMTNEHDLLFSPFCLAFLQIILIAYNSTGNISCQSLLWEVRIMEISVSAHTVWVLKGPVDIRALWSVILIYRRDFSFSFHRRSSMLCEHVSSTCCRVA